MYPDNLSVSEVIDMLVEVADEVSDRVYLRYVNGELSQSEMEACFSKIQVWSDLTQELADLEHIKSPF